MKKFISFIAAFLILTGSSELNSVRCADTVKNPVSETNSIILEPGDSASKKIIDVYVIKTAPSMMRQTSLDILCRQFKADRADEEAVISKVSGMTAAEMTAAGNDISNASYITNCLSELQANSAAEIKRQIDDIRKNSSKAIITIVNTYNPVDNIMTSGTTGLAAKLVFGNCVNQINTEINKMAAADENITVIDISKISYSKEYKEGMNGAEAAEVFKIVFEEQEEAISDKINNTMVYADKAMSGDINNDGVITVSDLVIMMQYYLNPDKVTADTLKLSRGDIDKNGIICELSDIAMLKNIII